MTMIARLSTPSTPSSLTTPITPTLRAFIGNELVGIATPIDSLYFITIQSDASGELRFETEDGTELTPINSEAINAEGTETAKLETAKPLKRPYPYFTFSQFSPNCPE